MISADASFASTDSTRRRSTFYVPLNSSDPDSPIVDLCTGLAADGSVVPLSNVDAEPAIYNPDLSACSFDYSLDDSLNNSSLLVGNDALIGTRRSPKSRRYGVVLNSIDLDADERRPRAAEQAVAAISAPTTMAPAQHTSNTSTPKSALTKSYSRSSIVEHTTPIKEKSATLPQNVSVASNTFPPKNSFLMKSSPRISLKYFSDSSATSAVAAATAATSSALATPSPKKSLSFIRRAHSTKLSRSNSLLKSLTSKCVDQGVEGVCRTVVSELQLERLELFFRADNCADLIRELFLREFADAVTPAVVSSPEAGCYRVKGGGGGRTTESPAGDDDSDVHSGKLTCVCDVLI